MISIHPSSAKALPGKTFAEGYGVAEARDIHELCWLVLAYHWSPIVWEGGRRLQERFVFSDWLALDFDSPEFTLVDAKRSFQGLTHLIGTTRSHQKWKHDYPPCDRFRVVVPWTSRITDLALYRYNIERSMRLYEHADPSAKDGARLFFPCTDIVQVEDDGDSWDVEPLPVDGEPKRYTRAGPQRHLSRFAVACLESAIPEHTRNNACFKLACEFARLGIEIDDAIARICMSPTYADIDMRKDRALFREIEKCVRSGYRSEQRKMSPTGMGDTAKDTQHLEAESQN